MFDGADLHDVIVDELLTKRSLAALIFLINAGRELEFSYKSRDYFISRDRSEKAVSLWEGEQQYSFESVEELIADSKLGGVPFVEAWDEIAFNTLF